MYIPHPCIQHISKHTRRAYYMYSLYVLLSAALPSIRFRSGVYNNKLAHHMQGVTLPSKMWAHHRFLILFFTTILIIIPSLFIVSSSSSSVDRVGGINYDGSAGGIAAAAAAAARNKLVDSICKQTSNYTFCVESIYTDPRAPKADDYFLLAYISFGLAYLNATDTLSYIKHELQLEEEDRDYAGISGTSTISTFSSLQIRCREDYEKAVSALEEAYNDLNSETYFDLKVLANSASQDALHCSSSSSSSSSQLQQQLYLLHSSSNFKAAAAVVGSGKGELLRRGHGHSVVVEEELRKRNADLRGLCEICVVVSNQLSN